MEPQKKRQVEYHKREFYSSGIPREPDNSNPLIAWLNSYRLCSMLKILDSSLSGKTVLSVCGGDGEEGHFFSLRGADVTVIDLCSPALEAAHRRNSRLRCLCMDAESLAFADNSFDWVVVREGLHHLARPVKALYEMERVSRVGFAIMEGQGSRIVRILVKLGFGDDRDPAGGYVYRFSRREIEKIFSSVQTVDRWRIQTAWIPFGSDMLKYHNYIRLLYPVLNHPLVLRILTSRPGKRVLKILFLGLNLLIGRWGNSFIIVAWKKPAGSDARGLCDSDGKDAS
jgi:ubiquinone/menaquinone biosynthesis C-methylase UbiE